jgi:hypothetical protein
MLYLQWWQPVKCLPPSRQDPIPQPPALYKQLRDVQRVVYVLEFIRREMGFKEGGVKEILKVSSRSVIGNCDPSAASAGGVCTALSWVFQ